MARGFSSTPLRAPVARSHSNSSSHSGTGTGHEGQAQAQDRNYRAKCDTTRALLLNHGGITLPCQHYSVVRSTAHLVFDLGTLL